LLSADDAGSVAAAADHLSVPVEKPRSGAEYLRALARQEAPPEAAPLLAAAAGLERATQIVRARQGQVITIYQLIDRGEADRYRTRVAAAAERLARVNVHISGPAPPYAFAQ
jgi:hypothetical protein